MKNLPFSRAAVGWPKMKEMENVLEFYSLEKVFSLLMTVSIGVIFVRVHFMDSFNFQHDHISSAVILSWINKCFTYLRVNMVTWNKATECYTCSCQTWGTCAVPAKTLVDKCFTLVTEIFRFQAQSWQSLKSSEGSVRRIWPGNLLMDILKDSRLAIFSPIALIFITFSH